MAQTSNESSRKTNDQIGNDLETKYELLAQCIRSDQLSAAQVWQEFRQDPIFYRWFKSKHGLLK